MTIENKEIAFSLFLDTLINFELHHKSSNEAPSWQIYELSVGKAIINLLCIVKAASIISIKEDAMPKISENIREIFLINAINAFKKTKAHSEIKVGPCVSNNEREVYTIDLNMFQVAIARISQKNFVSLFTNLLTLFPEELDYSDINFKSILQEYFQNKKLALPKYELIRTEGFKHDLRFHVSCNTSDGAKFQGVSNSKKQAEKAAAQLACKYYKITKRPTKPTSNIELNPNYDNDKVYLNQRICEAFGLSFNSSLISAFVPPRLKETHGRSNRKLANIGAHYIEYSVSQATLQIVKDSILTPSDCNKVIRFEGHSIDNKTLISIFETSFIKKADLPFKSHEDFDTLTYQADCIQALFGMSFHQYIDEKTVDSSPIYKTYASDWISKVIKSRNLIRIKINDDVTSIACARYYSNGFSIERIVIKKNIWALQIKHIRSGSEYELIYKGNLTTRKEVIESLSGTILKAIDRFEGVQFSTPETPESLEVQKSLFTFLFNSSVKDTELDSKIKIYISKKKEEIELSLEVLSLDDLIELWEINRVNLITRAHILYSIHKILGLNTTSTANDYMYLPAVYKKITGENFSFNLDTKEFDSTSIEAIEIDAAVVEKNKLTVKVTLNSAAELDKIKLLHIEDKYNALTIEELEDFWMTKESSFRYIEEAAIVLSLIRFERGVDFKKSDYRFFLNTEILSKLELPSLVNVQSNKVTPAIKLVIKPKIAEKAIQDFGYLSPHKSEIKDTNPFILTDTDERNFSSTKVANRIGQGAFRKKLSDLWKGCSISDCKTLSVLDAAHISPYRGEKDNDIRNGLLLRADLHRLFDDFLISVNPDTLTVHVSPKITDLTYTMLEGLKVQPEIWQTLSKAALCYHWFYFSNRAD